MIQTICSILSVAVLTGLLIPASITDIKQRIIPNRYPVSIASAGVLLMMVKIIVDRAVWKETILYALAGLMAGAGISALCRLIVKDGIGLGDVKLLMALGFYQGILIFPQMLAVSSIASLITALIVRSKDRPEKTATLPFAPFLSGGAVAAQIIGEFL